jgi:flagellar protein FlaJ
MLVESEKEKKSILSQYVVLMYAIALIFIAIVVAINKLLLPIFSSTTELGVGESIGLVNPCESCFDLACNICNGYNFISSFFLRIETTGIASYYTALFFTMSLIQSFFAGLVAGQISENSLVAGLKHSLILVAVTWGAFLILIQVGLLGV